MEGGEALYVSYSRETNYDRLVQRKMNAPEALQKVMNKKIFRFKDDGTVRWIAAAVAPAAAALPGRPYPLPPSPHPARALTSSP